MIPGAEHAPTIVVGYVTERGGFYRSIADIPVNERPCTEARRQLTVTDPDDRRVIWRLAALRYGLSEDDAADALLLPRWHLNADSGHQWSSEWVLCVPGTHVDRSAPLPMFWRLYAVDGSPVLHAADVAHATAALCAAVWGPA